MEMYHPRDVMTSAICQFLAGGGVRCALSIAIKQCGQADMPYYTKFHMITPTICNEHSLPVSPRFCKYESNTCSDWLNYTANQKLCYFQMILNLKKSGEQD